LGSSISTSDGSADLVRGEAEERVGLSSTKELGAGWDRSFGRLPEEGEMTGCVAEPLWAKRFRQR
jgi:hypothetical protein